VRQRIEAIKEDVILLAHSLGGIACVDLLAKHAHELPQVKGLITAGSQAPLLHEIGALYSLNANEQLPDHFPYWLNLYDPYDFLSYLAKPVFGRQEMPEKISDKRLESGQPFPQSHSAYWTNSDTWQEISRFLAKVCP
jgi:pimeloyl-ACP methyl ester carboxylesterase